MEKKRFIFDLDGTLLTSDFHLEREMFYDFFGEKASEFNKHVGEYLFEYESLFPRYDIGKLSLYLRLRSGLNFTPRVIREWINTTGKDPGVIEDGVIEFFDYLKSNDCSIGVLTNWFHEAQVPRLRESGLLDYVDQVYGGDFFLKPNRDAYIAAMEGFNASECIMIGDNLEKDYAGPRTCDIESILYDKYDIQDENVVKVKRIDEIIGRYLGG